MKNQAEEKKIRHHYCDTIINVMRSRVIWETCVQAQLERVI